MTIKTRKYFSNLLFKTFPNIGWVEIKLTKFIMDYLKDCIIIFIEILLGFGTNFISLLKLSV